MSNALHKLRAPADRPLRAVKDRPLARGALALTLALVLTACEPSSPDSRKSSDSTVRPTTLSALVGLTLGDTVNADSATRGLISPAVRTLARGQYGVVGDTFAALAFVVADTSIPGSKHRVSRVLIVPLLDEPRRETGERPFRLHLVAIERPQDWSTVELLLAPGDEVYIRRTRSVAGDAPHTLVACVVREEGQPARVLELATESDELRVRKERAARGEECPTGRYH